MDRLFYFLFLKIIGLDANNSSWCRHESRFGGLLVNVNHSKHYY